MSAWLQKAQAYVAVKKKLKKERKKESLYLRLRRQTEVLLYCAPGWPLCPVQVQLNALITRTCVKQRYYIVPQAGRYVQFKFS